MPMSDMSAADMSAADMSKTPIGNPVRVLGSPVGFIIVSC